MKPGNRISALGGIYRVVDGEEPEYWGSCAALRLPTHFVTAAHCIDGVGTHELTVNHMGHRQFQFSPVRRTWTYEPSDIAVLETVVEDPKWIAPFRFVRGGAG